MYNAALVHGTMSHILDYDDAHLGALMHPSVPVIPALLAYGQWRKESGRQFLLSLILGIEAETRISMAMGSSHYEKGWHSTATVGRFGAAAGVGKMARLPSINMAYAMGLAGTQASGLRMVFGTMTKSFHPGKAAADGLLSVLWAKQGYTAPENILEGEQGLGMLLSSDFNYERGFHGLGTDYNIMGISFKPYASCLYTHPIVYGITQLKKEHRITPQNVKKIECQVSKICYDAACKEHPETGLAAKFSSYYCAALAVLEGKAGNDLFGDECLANDKYRQCMKKVKITLNPLLTESQANISIYLNNGKCCSYHVDHPLGDPCNPLDDQSLEIKARDLLGVKYTPKQIAEIIKTIWNFESVKNLEEFSNLFRK